MLSKIKIFLIGIWVPNALVPHKNQFWDPLIPTPDGLLKRIYKCDPVNVVYKIITGSAGGVAQYINNTRNINIPWRPELGKEAR